MSDVPQVERIDHLNYLGNVVPESYMYYEKHITPGEDLSLPTAYLKWYDLYPVETEITPEQFAKSRLFLAGAVERLMLQDEQGFVILHRAGSVLLLLLTTWRNTNEIWEATYIKDLTGTGDYQAIEYENLYRATYCVWELGAVWHERNAWVQFLSSRRDDEAKLAYISDRFSGRV